MRTLLVCPDLSSRVRVNLCTHFVAARVSFSVQRKIIWRKSQGRFNLNVLFLQKPFSEEIFHDIDRG